MNIPQQSSFTVAGYTFTQAEIARLRSGTTGIILAGFAISAGQSTSLGRINFLAAVVDQYQVPAGKTLTIIAMIGTGAGTPTNPGFRVLAGDIPRNDQPYEASMTYPQGNSVLSGGYSGAVNQNGAFIGVQFPAGKYIHITSDSNQVQCVAYCFID